MTTDLAVACLLYAFGARVSSSLGDAGRGLWPAQEHDAPLD
jgi:hypothetical protein